MCSFSSVKAQFNFDSSNAYSDGIGSIQSIHSHVFSVLENQAGLANLEKTEIGIAAKNFYLLGDVNSFHLAAALPTKSGTFGLGISTNGTEGYQELKAGIAYGRNLFDAFQIGAQINFYSLNIQNYGNTAVVNFDLGVQANLTDEIVIGGHIQNPIPVDIDIDEFNQLPNIITLGLAYSLSDKVKIMAEAEQNLQSTPIIKAGIDYRLAEAIALRFGYRTDPSVFHFGAGLNLNPIKIDLAASFHPVLGYSPMLSIQYGF